MANEEKEHHDAEERYGSSELAEHWQQDVERRRHDFAEATQRMLEAAGLEPGDHVLDIAAGTGDQSILGGTTSGTGRIHSGNRYFCGNAQHRRASWPSRRG